MIALTPFQPSDFPALIAWIDNKELLVQIAGTVLTWPLTDAQLQTYLDDPRSIAFNIVDTEKHKTIGHAEIYLTGDGTCKIDKLLIGDRSNRGKGLGLQVIHELLTYSFEKLPVHTVELNVYDWNIAGIKCYIKAGFTANPDKKLFTRTGDINWTAFNMTMQKEEWVAMKNPGQPHITL
jgi:RimJ/RimL family protein N-acetyltransferase